MRRHNGRLNSVSNSSSHSSRQPPRRTILRQSFVLSSWITLILFATLGIFHGFLHNADTSDMELASSPRAKQTALIVATVLPLKRVQGFSPAAALSAITRSVGNLPQSNSSLVVTSTSVLVIGRGAPAAFRQRAVPLKTPTWTPRRADGARGDPRSSGATPGSGSGSGLPHDSFSTGLGSGVHPEKKCSILVVPGTKTATPRDRSGARLDASPQTETGQQGRQGHGKAGGRHSKRQGAKPMRDPTRHLEPWDVLHGVTVGWIDATKHRIAGDSDAQAVGRALAACESWLQVSSQRRFLHLPRFVAAASAVSSAASPSRDASPPVLSRHRALQDEVDTPPSVQAVVASVKDRTRMPRGQSHPADVGVRLGRPVVRPRTSVTDTRLLFVEPGAVLAEQPLPAWIGKDVVVSLQRHADDRDRSEEDRPDDSNGLDVNLVSLRASTEFTAHTFTTSNGGDASSQPNSFSPSLFLLHSRLVFPFASALAHSSDASVPLALSGAAASVFRKLPGYRRQVLPPLATVRPGPHWMHCALQHMLNRARTSDEATQASPGATCKRIVRALTAGAVEAELRRAPTLSEHEKWGDLAERAVPFLAQPLAEAICDDGAHGDPDGLKCGQNAPLAIQKALAQLRSPLTAISSLPNAGFLVLPACRAADSSDSPACATRIAHGATQGVGNAVRGSGKPPRERWVHAVAFRGNLPALATGLLSAIAAAGFDADAAVERAELPRAQSMGSSRLSRTPYAIAVTDVSFGSRVWEAREPCSASQSSQPLARALHLLRPKSWQTLLESPPGQPDSTSCILPHVLGARPPIFISRRPGADEVEGAAEAALLAQRSIHTSQPDNDDPHAAPPSMLLSVASGEAHMANALAGLLPARTTQAASSEAVPIVVGPPPTSVFIPSDPSTPGTAAALPLFPPSAFTETASDATPCPPDRSEPASTLPLRFISPQTVKRSRALFRIDQRAHRAVGILSAFACAIAPLTSMRPALNRAELSGTDDATGIWLPASISLSIVGTRGSDVAVLTPRLPVAQVIEVDDESSVADHTLNAPLARSPEAAAVDPSTKGDDERHGADEGVGGGASSRRLLAESLEEHPRADAGGSIFQAPVSKLESPEELAERALHAPLIADPCHSTDALGTAWTAGPMSAVVALLKAGTGDQLHRTESSGDADEDDLPDPFLARGLWSELGAMEAVSIRIARRGRESYDDTEYRNKTIGSRPNFERGIPQRVWCSLGAFPVQSATRRFAKSLARGGVDIDSGGRAGVDGTGSDARTQDAERPDDGRAPLLPHPSTSALSLALLLAALGAPSSSLAARNTAPFSSTGPPPLGQLLDGTQAARHHDARRRVTLFDNVEPLGDPDDETIDAASASREDDGGEPEGREEGEREHHLADADDAAEESPSEVKTVKPTEVAQTTLASQYAMTMLAGRPALDESTGLGMVRLSRRPESLADAMDPSPPAMPDTVPLQDSNFAVARWLCVHQSGEEAPKREDYAVAALECSGMAPVLRALGAGTLAPGVEAAPESIEQFHEQSRETARQLAFKLIQNLGGEWEKTALFRSLAFAGRLGLAAALASAEVAVLSGTGGTLSVAWHACPSENRIVEGEATHESAVEDTGFGAHYDSTNTTDRTKSATTEPVRGEGAGGTGERNLLSTFAPEEATDELASELRSAVEVLDSATRVSEKGHSVVVGTVDQASVATAALMPVPGPVRCITYTNGPLILLTFNTHDRFWTFMLSITALLNGVGPALWARLRILVLDDNSDDNHAEQKAAVLRSLVRRGLVWRVENARSHLGFVRSREYLASVFLSDPSFTHWIHADDDIVLGRECIMRALADYTQYLSRTGGLLVIWLNYWSKVDDSAEPRGPLHTSPYVGAPAFIVDRRTLEMSGGNPYTGYLRAVEESGDMDASGFSEGSNKHFWSQLHAAGLHMWTNTRNPYPSQHISNAVSLIHGDHPSWEGLYATEREGSRQGEYVQVPPYDFDELREAIQAGEAGLQQLWERLAEDVWAVVEDGQGAEDD